MITELKLLTTLHWTILFFFFHVNWCSTVGKYLLIVLRMFIHSLIFFFKINPISEKHWKIAPVLQIQASSMKPIVHGFLFLVFLHIKMDGKNKLFFYNHINIQIRKFFSELVESKSLGKYCLIMIRIGMNTVND